MIEYFAIFSALFCVDVIWAFYIRAAAQGKALRASVLSSTIYFLSTVSFVTIVDNLCLLIPAVLGAFLGTYIAIKWETKNKRA